MQGIPSANGAQMMILKPVSDKLATRLRLLAPYTLSPTKKRGHFYTKLTLFPLLTMKSSLARAIFIKGGIINIIAKYSRFSIPTSYTFHCFIT
jgi:hypothetical protein